MLIEMGIAPHLQRSHEKPPWRQLELDQRNEPEREQGGADQPTAAVNLDAE
jgi:hypothetical protein